MNYFYKYSSCPSSGRYSAFNWESNRLRSRPITVIRHHRPPSTIHHLIHPSTLTSSTPSPNNPFRIPRRDHHTSPTRPAQHHEQSARNPQPSRRIMIPSTIPIPHSTDAPRPLRLIPKIYAPDHGQLSDGKERRGEPRGAERMKGPVAFVRRVRVRLRESKGWWAGNGVGAEMGGKAR